MDQEHIVAPGTPAVLDDPADSIRVLAVVAAGEPHPLRHWPSRVAALIHVAHGLLELVTERVGVGEQLEAA